MQNQNVLVIIQIYLYAIYVPAKERESRNKKIALIGLTWPFHNAGRGIFANGDFAPQDIRHFLRCLCAKNECVVRVCFDPAQSHDGN